MARTEDPTAAAAFGARVRAMVEAIGTQAAVAAKLGVSERQLRQYMQAKHAPTFALVAELAALSGFDLRWAASGEGSPRGVAPRPTSRILMGRVEELVERAYRDSGAALSARARGETVARLYDELVAVVDPSTSPDDAAAHAALTLLARQLRQQLEADALAQPKADRGKRSA